MKYRFTILFLCLSSLLFSQEKNEEQLIREAKKDVREGNKLYNQLKFAEAEVAYKKALAKNPNYPTASYNLGNTSYQLNRNKEAVNQFEIVEKTFENKLDKAQTYHNMGNAFMKEKQYDKAVQAYKNSLRNNSKDDETRYNLALAQEMLKNQQNQDNKDNKNDKNNQDKNNQNKDNKEKDDKKNDEKDKGKDKQDPNSDKEKNQNQQNKPQQRKSELSPEQIKQLLEAMNNEENKTQKKLNLQKSKGQKVKQEKDW